MSMDKLVSLLEEYRRREATARTGDKRTTYIKQEIIFTRAMGLAIEAEIASRLPF